MSDLINRETLLHDAIGIECGWLHPPKGVCSVSDLIRKAPSVDAEPVRHGRWIEHYKRPASTMFDCSVCGGIAYDAQKNKSQPKRCSYRYCPRCGAKMDAKEESTDA